MATQVDGLLKVWSLLSLNDIANGSILQTQYSYDSQWLLNQFVNAFFAN